MGFNRIVVSALSFKSSATRESNSIVLTGRWYKVGGFEMETIKNIDKTINDVCFWIQEELKRTIKSGAIEAEMISALAQLISARADTIKN